jgi:hypothetical protein
MRSEQDDLDSSLPTSIGGYGDMRKQKNLPSTVGSLTSKYIVLVTSHSLEIRAVNIETLLNLEIFHVTLYE